MASLFDSSSWENLPEFVSMSKRTIVDIYREANSPPAIIKLIEMDNSHFHSVVFHVVCNILDIDPEKGHARSHAHRFCILTSRRTRDMNIQWSKPVVGDYHFVIFAHCATHSFQLWIVPWDAYNGYHTNAIPLLSKKQFMDYC